jgi:hypothetical protein
VRNGTAGRRHGRIGIPVVSDTRRRGQPGIGPDSV